MITISGRTFDHRDTLKSMGARWNGDSKTWLLSSATPRELRELRAMVGVTISGVPTEDQPRPKPTLDADAAISAMLERHDREQINKAIERAGRKPSIHGNDKSWFNYFADQNPTSYFGFSSLYEFIKFIKAVPAHVIRDETERRNDPWEETRTGWYGTSSMAETLDLARNGWPEGVEMAQELVDRLIGRHAQERRRKYSVAGGAVNVGRMLADDPKHMISRPRQPGKKVITLFVEASLSSSIEIDNAIIRAAMVAAICDILEMNGYVCEIISVDITRDNDNYRPSYQIVTVLKEAGEPLNLNDIVFALGHPSYLRRMCLGAMAVDQRLYNVWRSGGTPHIAFNKNHPTKKNELYIKPITHENQREIKGDTLIEKAFSIWDLITDQTLPIELNRS